MPEEMVTLSKTEIKKKTRSILVESLGTGYALAAYVIFVSQGKEKMKHPLINIGIGIAIATIGMLMRPKD